MHGRAEDECPGIQAAKRPRWTDDEPVSARHFPTTPVPDWDTRFPWLRAGTTRRRAALSDAGPLGSGTVAGTPDAMADPGVPPLQDMFALAAGRPWRSVVRSRQVHGSLTLAHVDASAGTIVAGEADGHVTGQPGVLLTVTIADCVPVFMADPVRRAVGLLHAGWRGVAAGVIESGIATLSDAFGSTPGDTTVHLGPAICGQCYEVGPEVFRALGERTPAIPRPIDLRRVIRGRATESGVRPEQVTVSHECTRCGDGRYFSHRRGDEGRQRAFIGIVA